MLSALEIHERRDTDAVVLALQGELEFLASAGVGVLHRAIRAGEDGWTLDLTGPARTSATCRR